MNEVIDAMFERVVSTNIFRFLPCTLCNHGLQVVVMPRHNHWVCPDCCDL